jgi:hypothetical protein
MIKISQSFLKSYSDYKSDFSDKCGLQLKAQYIDNIEFPTSEAMDLGNYFEYMATDTLPRSGKKPEPVVSYKGKANEKLSAPYERANESAIKYSELIKELGIEVIEYQKKLSTDTMTGIADIYAKWNGRYCFIDLKYSGLLDDKWNDMGWEINSLPEKHKLMVQGVQYTVMAKDVLKHEYEDFDFYYFLFSQKDPNDIRIIKQIIDFDTLEMHRRHVSHVFDEINNNPLDKIFKARPSLKLCSKCPLEDCKSRTNLPIVQNVYY